MEMLLDVRNLRVLYPGMAWPVLDNVSLTLEKGRVLGIVGESGCGKTTLAHTIIGALARSGKVQHGEILFQGKDLLKASAKELRFMQGNELGMIVQASLSSLNPVRKIGSQSIQLLCEKTGVSGHEAAATAVYFLEKMSCPQNTMRKFPFQLSGGQRQRVIIAMAFALHPKLLIADEPTTALDVTVQAQVLHEMMELKKNNQTGILLISHNLGVLAQICDEIAVMYRGRILEYGDVGHILLQPSHPYTIGLINSIPDLELDRSKRLYNIPDSRESNDQGCVFSARCERCAEQCLHNLPSLRRNDEGVLVACLKSN